jgi:hypothetical protein
LCDASIRLGDRGFQALTLAQVGEVTVDLVEPCACLCIAGVGREGDLFTLTREQYCDSVGTVGSSTEVMAAGNILFGGLIGLGVDAASSAMNKYEPSVEIAMTPIPNCGRPGKGRGVPMASTPVAPQRPPS